MKTKNFSFVGFMVVLMGMTTSATSFAQSLDPKQLQSMINSQCMREIRESKVWRNAMAFQNLPEQAKMKKNACDCVYKDASQDSSIKNLLSTPLYNDTQGRDIVSKVVLKSLRTCTQQILN